MKLTQKYRFRYVVGSDPVLVSDGTQAIHTGVCVVYFSLAGQMAVVSLTRPQLPLSTCFRFHHSFILMFNVKQVGLLTTTLKRINKQSKKCVRRT
jgi:hypothetical protein